jgi:hypothetical protein
MSNKTMGADAGTEEDTDVVPDFTTEGFEGGALESSASGTTTLNVESAHAQLSELQALSVSGCVGASYNAARNQLCFTLPIYGRACVPSPIRIPVGGRVLACFTTCGSIIPRGLRVTLRLNNRVLLTKTFGFC